jgi:Ribbon-helix-helix protein, copG family
MRVLIDVPDEDLEWLDRKAAEQGKSRAALVREAIAEYRVEKGKQGIERFFGIWRDRKDIGDGLEHQRRMREDWGRPADGGAQ